ncbi:hypothetical protein MJO29_001036 [Puccinia striiformis f. sp. tritici]|nr:hypothetical protein Pst134EA_001027 [Puccinia striiformis f. sp. tritici]KAH9467224.1 hypothetical protein Pst134EB_002246 [Puccinia striiformis f. sp. tritici]KAH9473973.1 hypothetical protein Pst134EA_001027 [Puccinia striiformis f. sp. tritici]KAI7967759.1 hypothetical protein MJO29_001036 [Puccinia striiformis f. sp. tritici]
MDAAPAIRHHSWTASTPVRSVNPPLGSRPHYDATLHNDVPCENCDYQHRCVRPTDSLGSCHRCSSLNLPCRPKIDRHISAHSANSRNLPRDPIPKLESSVSPVSDTHFSKPPIMKTASSTPPHLRSSKPQGTMETSVKRGPGKGCIPTLDARLSRLENLLGEALPHASHILNPAKHAAGLANQSPTTGQGWKSYPSQIPSVGARTKMGSRESPLQLPEDPLLDGAMEDALLAGQPIHERYSYGHPTIHTQKGNITTARLFLESHRK